MMRFPICGCLLVLSCLTTSEVCSAQPPKLKIAETIWGFDGRVVVGQFNPFSVLIDNLSDETIEGQVTLRSIQGMVRESGGTLSEPLYLAPNSRRWVQFYPYVSQISADWRLNVRAGGSNILTASFDPPRGVFGLQLDDADSRRVSAVILDRTGMATQQPISVKHMPAEIFPPFSTATSGLSVLFLDHVPDWETPRQEALLAWLKRGGRLCLLLDSNGQTLSFSGVLSPLNEPFTVFRTGFGTVNRLDIQRGQLSDEIVRPFVQLPGGQDENNPAAEFGNSIAQQNLMVFNPSANDDETFASMRKLTQPEHAWWAIFLLSLVYVGLIFPGCWILSRKKTLHFLVTYGAIAGVSVLFSLIFLMIGRRGYGESTVMNSLTIARSEDSTHWNTMQWLNLFVVSGDNYQVTSENQQALLASGDADDRGVAGVKSGNHAMFETRIPPFSSQSVVSARRLTQPDWALVLEDIEITSGVLTKLELTTGSTFPDHPDCQYLILHGQRLSTAVFRKEDLKLRLGSSLQTLADYCSIRADPEYSFGLFGQQPRYSSDSDSQIDRFYRYSIHPLIHRSLLDDGIVQPSQFVLPADRIRLFVYTPATEEVLPSLNVDSLKQGRTLFIRDILLDPDSAGAATVQ
jgi:hypothetical protein